MRERLGWCLLFVRTIEGSKKDMGYGEGVEKNE